MTLLLTRRLLLALPVAGFAVGSTIDPAQAADYPTHTITLVVPFGPGGGADVVARIIAPGLSRQLKQDVIVENKPGGQDIVGTEYVSRAAPNGYTILVGTIDMVINQAIYKKLPYNALVNFVPIAKLVTIPLFVIVKGNSPIKTIHDLVVYAKENPDKATYSSAGGVFWLAAEHFAQQTGIKVTRVAYNGAGAMTLAVVSGEVLFSISSAPPVIGQAKAGTLRVLATTAPHRVPAFPDVPTMAEAGVPGVSATGWIGLWAPGKTPENIVAILNDAAHRALSMANIEAEMGKLNLTISDDSPSDFKRQIQSELALWKQVAKKANISVTL